jgi:hypothetical protein
MTGIGIRHIDFVPGDVACDYRSLPGIEERIAALGIPDEPAFWGWGRFHRSSGDYRDHLMRGFAGTRARLANEAGRIDRLILCAPCVNDCDAFVEGVAALALPGFSSDTLDIVRDQDCVNLIGALDLARQRIAEGAGRVLILASEKVAKETHRFKRFSLFSDYSLAVEVCAGLSESAYELVDTLIRPDPEPGEDTNSVLGRSMEKQCVAEILGRNRLAAGDIDRFCYIHLYEPMYQMKGKDLGFSARKMACGRIAELGHCYGADPFVGLLTHLGEGSQTPDDRTALLCASSRQYAGLALVRRTSGAESRRAC